MRLTCTAQRSLSADQDQTQMSRCNHSHDQIRMVTTVCQSRRINADNMKCNSFFSLSSSYIISSVFCFPFTFPFSPSPSLFISLFLFVLLFFSFSSNHLFLSYFLSFFFCSGDLSFSTSFILIYHLLSLI